MKKEERRRNEGKSEERSFGAFLSQEHDEGAGHQC